MAGSFPGIVLQKGTYYARVAVPKDVRHLFDTAELWQTLKTGNFGDAKKAAPPILAEFKRRIASARRGSIYEHNTQMARIAMAKWAARKGMRPDESAETVTHTTWEIQARAEAFKNAWTNPEGWRQIPDFDADLIEALRIGGFRVSKDDPVIPLFRQEAALTFMYATLSRERDRLASAFQLRMDAVAATDLDEIVTSNQTPEKPLPPPAITIRQLFERWVASVKPVEKERGRLEHQIRRLVEVIGDKPANYVSKSDIEEFMALVARFPGRKRPVRLNVLPMRELIATFELEKLKRPDTEWKTLTGTTAGEWFAAYHRMFRYGVLMELIPSNPFEGLKFTAKGAASVKRRGYTDAEIADIFSSPAFQGFSTTAGPQRLRSKAGSEIVRDAKYWLPILSLFHGARLTELAAMHLADLKVTDGGVHFFDLTKRTLKTETSKRLVPLHPHMNEIGFLDYVAGLRTRGAEWLFPDLDHTSKLGPGHEFSKWWGEWCDERGLDDPAITHHSWRHTWKRRARSSEVKEEMHDIISGHKPVTIGRVYGAGAEIEDLARDMALITFPAFPPLPGPTI